MNTYLLAGLALLISAIIIVSIKSVLYNKNFMENFEEINDELHNDELHNDFTNLMPKNIEAIPIYRISNEITAPPEIVTSPRLSTFSRYIRS